MRTSVLVAGAFAFLLLGCVASPRATVQVTPYMPPAADDSALAKALPEGHTAGTFVDVGDVRIVGVNNAKAPAKTDYLTLHEALTANLCTVAEKDGVNGLAITNRANQPIFLMVGDLVLGGKQDRIMAESIVVEAGANGETIPVFCVEHGRWSEEAGSSEFYGREKSQQADVSVKSAAITTASQSDVWAAVAANNQVIGLNPSTGTFRATFDDPATMAKLDAMYAKAKAALTADTVGFAVLYKNEVVAMDLFDSKGLCAKLSEKLLRSYLVTAISSGYDPAPKHPLHQRLEDRVTLQAVGVRLDRVVAALNSQWSVTISLEGNAGTPITLDLKDQPMFEVLLQLAEASKLPIYIGRGSVVVDATPAQGETETKPEAGVYAGMPRSAGDIDDIQFGGNGIPLLTDIPVMGELFRRQGTGNDSGFFFQDTPPSGNVRIDQRANIENLFDESLGGQRDGEEQNRGGSSNGGAHRSADEPALAEINESTETERKYDEDGVDYSCKDKKRDSTVHRAYMRR